LAIQLAPHEVAGSVGRSGHDGTQLRIGILNAESFGPIELHDDPATRQQPPLRALDPCQLSGYSIDPPGKAAQCKSDPTFDGGSYLSIQPQVAAVEL
jgi:hypothetical protein